MHEMVQNNPLCPLSLLEGAKGKLVTTGSRELGKNAELVCDEGHYYPKPTYLQKVNVFCDKKSSHLKWIQTDGSEIVSCVKGNMFSLVVLGKKSNIFYRLFFGSHLR